jgi:glycosyltransferase involved in cell wall biosynthesis
MKFSISTSFYRRSHLVENLYQQILNQTYSDWEWIVTDDFSDYNNAKDILLEICSKDPRVKYYEQSRKKECFYNPQYGCTGDIIIQFDSDDYAYPRILEIYNHMFLKHPDVMGISCLSHTIDQQNNFVDIQGGGTYKFEEYSTFNYTPMGRAWRNIITEFDDGTLKWYQNDTNIVRHIENKGKWLYLPRTLYRYYYSQDTFSRDTNRTPEVYDEIENERIYIENKFPHLHNSSKLTTSLYYLPIHQTARSLGFGDFNLSKTRQKILYIKYDIKIYEKQLLKELFYDHDLLFDIEENQHIDEINVFLDDDGLDELNIMLDKLKLTNPNTHIKLYLNSQNNLKFEKAFDFVEKNFPLGFGWVIGGYETYFITAL